MRRLRSGKRIRQSNVIVTLFQVAKFIDLGHLPSPERTLEPGSPFTIELKFHTWAPFADAFDLAGAELIFKKFMPPGLRLLDVRGRGRHEVVIRTEVVGGNTAEAGQGTAEMGFVFTLGAVGNFIAANWLGISLVTIGLTFALGLLVASITGKGVLGDPKGAADALAKGALVAVVVAGVIFFITRPKKGRTT